LRGRRTGREQIGGMTGVSRSRVTALVGVCCLLVGPASRPAVAEDTEFTVHVSYDEFHDEVRPRVERRYVKQMIAFTPLERRTLRVIYVRTFRIGVEAETAEVALDSPGEGRFRSVRWSRPGEGSTYVRVQTTPTYVKSITVTIEGETCRADVRFDLKSGASEYLLVRVKETKRKGLP
jgi:hypothetical protein